LLFVDDFSRMTWVYFLKHKSEVPDKFYAFYQMIHTQFGKKIQVLRSNNGGEFVNKSMQEFFRKNGLIHQISCLNTPQHNGVAKRKNRKLLEMTRTMIFYTQVPTRFWPEVVATSAYLLNTLPSQTLNHRTLLQILATQTNIPPIQMLPPQDFGCSVFVHILKANKTKFNPCAEKCVFVGYVTHQKGYRCYNPITHRVYVTMDCDSLESEYFFSTQLDVQGGEN